MTPAILAIFAHPDDESACSGTLAMAVDRGWKVVLAVATRGEAGEIADSSLASPETLGKVREIELQAACEMLGIEQVRFLDYRDSGMAGTPENELPDSLFRADPRQVIGQITGLIRELCPQIVITFEPFGVYGHPDHIIISRCTTQAFDLAGDPGAFPDSGAPWKSQRLYYDALPVKWFKSILDRIQDLALDASVLEQMVTINRENLEKIDPQITHENDVSAYVDAKIDSLACHRTQLTSHSPFKNLLNPELRDLMAKEYFIQARPEETSVDFFEL
jgi:LmbE family N-acetylglucosaminyl deacetylase